MQQIVFAMIAGMLITAGTGCSSSAKSAKTGDENDVKQDERPVPPEAPPYPKAVVDEVTHDFGIMEAGTVGKHSFTIKNEGDFPLELAKGPTTCKCTLNSLNKKTLQKGESTTVDLEWTPPGETPDFGQSAEIFTNDPDRTSISFQIRGRVEKIAELVPAGRWSMGVVEGEGERTVFGDIKSGILDKFDIEGIYSKADDLAISHRPLTEKELKIHKAKSGYRITVKLQHRDVVGIFNKRLTIKTSVNQSKGKDGESYVVDIVGTRTGPILIRALPGVTWNSEGMQLSIKPFNGTTGTSASLMLFVGGLKNADMTIKKISSDPEFIQVKLEPIKIPDLKTVKQKGQKPAVRRKTYRLIFQFPPGSPSVTRTRIHPAIVTISTTHPKVKTITFSLVFRSN